MGVLFTFPYDVRNEHYFIASSQDHCDSLDEGSCLTLSSFVAITSNLFQKANSYDSTTVPILYPGNHILYSNLTFAHVKQLCVYSNSSHSFDTNIVCIKHAARFEFANITLVHISNIKLLRCGGNRAELVMHFTLINTVFDGQQTEDLGTALVLVNSILKAEKSSLNLSPVLMMVL